MNERAAVGFVTGTDTGVGKTVFAALLTRRTIQQGFTVRAVKPFCSGGRDDAKILREAAGEREDLDTINPWHYRVPLTPLIAARREGHPATLTEACGFVERARYGVERLIVEGAGGLLSPLGEGYDARDLIRKFRPHIWIVAANRLGCLNQILLTVEALGSLGARARIILMQPRTLNIAARTNLTWLRERLGAERVQPIPWLAHSWRSPWKRSWLPALDWP